MKNTLILAFLAIVLMACGGDNTSTTETVKKKKSLGCADIYTEKYIESKFPDVQEIKGGLYSGTCAYIIRCKNETYNTFYSVQQNATESMLTQSLSYFEGAKPFKELGDNSYIYPVGGIKQVTFLDNGNLISTYVWLTSNGQFDKEQTIELVRDMNEKLK